MKIQKILLQFILLTSIVSGFLFSPPHVEAFFLTDWINTVKNQFISGFAHSIITVESTITFAPEGDVNHDGVFDPGDTITFSYTVINTSQKDYPLATLLTHVPRTMVHFVHNVRGAASLSELGDTINIPNLFIGGGQRLMISFDARINYIQLADQVITTEPEVIASENAPLAKGKKNEIRIQPFNGVVPGMSQKRKNN